MTTLTSLDIPDDVLTLRDAITDALTDYCASLGLGDMQRIAVVNIAHGYFHDRHYSTASSIALGRRAADKLKARMRK